MRKVTLLLFFCFCTNAAASQPGILIDSRLARRMQLSVGNTVELAATGDMKNAESFQVKSVYDGKADPYSVTLERNTIKMHLPDLERLIARPDQVDLISISLKKRTDAAELAERLNSEAIGFTAYSAPELARRSSATFQVVNRFQEAIALITMMAGAIFIFALVVMRVEDQRKNLAILSVTGISRSTIMKSLVLESLFFALIASLLGAVSGCALTKTVNVYYQYYYQTSLVFARVTGPILMRAILLSFLLGLLAGTFAWFRLRRLPILEELGR
jgi:ABC-type lipoprotein release transport system permease subunit